MKDFVFPTHKAMAELCAESYSRHTFAVSEVEALMVDMSQYIVLVFCGTEVDGIKPKSLRWKDIKASISNVRDIFRDLRFYPMKTPTGRVHRGFYLSATRWVNEFLDELPDKPIYLGGHSKGAAEAGLVAELLHAAGRTIKEVVLWGEPASRFGASREHYQNLCIPTNSYINKGDWIRRAPPWGFTVTRRTKLKGDKGHDIQSYINNLEKRYG